MLTATLAYDSKNLHIHPNKSTIADELYVIFTTEHNEHYTRLRLDIHPKQDVVLKNIQIELDFKLTPSVDKVFCNGFQSWSESRFYAFDEQPPQLWGLAKPFIGQYYGDNHLDLMPRTKGTLHSWTYGYTCHVGADTIDFVGSLNESTAFTCLIFDAHKQKVILKKDIQDLHLSHSFPVFDVLLMAGEMSSVFNHYQLLQNIALKPQPKALAWSSWHYYFNKINDNIIRENLDTFSNLVEGVSKPVHFYIDAGWQSRVGDWLIPQSGFPPQLKPLADAIHQKGFKAGLWLAPFVAESKSRLYNEKPHWILRGGNGKPLVVGYSPYWSGQFYALDIYQKEVQEYLTGVLHAMLNQWGFDILKLDFLYAVCALPRPDKTRAQVMTDAIAFVRSIAGDKILLACGVPLGSVFGKVDFCRVGADVTTTWEHRLGRWLCNRERASTVSALHSVVGRWYLNNRFFQNDPDICILRNDKNALSDAEKELLLTVNSLLGNLLTTSDNVGHYTPQQIAFFKKAIDYQDFKVEKVKLIGDDNFEIFAEKNGHKVVFTVDLNKKFVSKS